MKKVALHNLGCKVNAYETEAMQEMLEQKRPDFFSIGYYLTFSDKALPEMPVEQLNAQENTENA